VQETGTTSASITEIQDVTSSTQRLPSKASPYLLWGGACQPMYLVGSMLGARSPVVSFFQEKAVQRLQMDILPGSVARCSGGAVGDASHVR
jgi:hypothetical protein